MRDRLLPVIPDDDHLVEFVANSDDEDDPDLLLLSSSTFSQPPSVSQSSVRTQNSDDFEETVLPIGNPTHRRSSPLPSTSVSQPRSLITTPLSPPLPRHALQIESLPTAHHEVTEPSLHLNDHRAGPSSNLSALQMSQRSHAGSPSQNSNAGRTGSQELASATPEAVYDTRGPPIFTNEDPRTATLGSTPLHMTQPDLSQQQQYDQSPPSPPLPQFRMPQQGDAPQPRIADLDISPSSTSSLPISARMTTQTDDMTDEAAARAAAALPPTPPQRQFRARKAAQLNPYTLEAMKYQRTLIRNDWQDAVVSQREWHRQERRRIAEEEAKTKAAVGSDPQRDSQSQWLVDSSGPSSEAEQDESMLETSQPFQPDLASVSAPRSSALDRDHAIRARSPSSNPLPLDVVSQRRSSPVAGPSTERTKTYKSSHSKTISARKERNALLISSSDSEEPIETAFVRRKHQERDADMDLINQEEARRTEDSSEDERPARALKVKPRRSRWSGDGSSSDSTDYERRFRQLKKMMPAGMARKHIRDLRAMRHGKRYHSDGHVSSASSVRSDNSATVGDVTMTSAQAAGDTPTTSPQDAAGELRPGQTRKRLRRYDSLEAQNALLLEPDSDSSSSNSSSSVVELDAAQEDDNDTDTAHAAWWTADPQPSHAVYREQDAIDRMLSRTTERRRQINKKPRKSSSARPSWQARLDGFVSAAANLDRPGVLREKDSNRNKVKPSANTESPNGTTKPRMQKKRKFDPRVGRSERQYLGPTVLRANPPIVRPRTRPRLDLHHDDVLFARYPNNRTEGHQDQDSEYDLTLLVHHRTDEVSDAASLHARLVQPRIFASSEQPGGFSSPNGAAARIGATTPASLSLPTTSGASNRPRDGAAQQNARSDARIMRPGIGSPYGQLSIEHSAKRDIDIHPDAEQWDDFQGIRVNFDISKVSAGVLMNRTIPLLQDDYLRNLVALPDHLIQGDPITLSWSGGVLRLEDIVLTMDMDQQTMLAALPTFCDRLRHEISGAFSSRNEAAEIGCRRVMTILSDTRVFLCCWLMHQYTHNPSDSTAVLFQAYRAVLSRIDTLQASLLTSVPSVWMKDVSLQLCWLRLELCWRTLAISDTHPSNALETEAPTIDELLIFSRTLMSLLLYHGLHKSIRSLRLPSSRVLTDEPDTSNEISAANTDESASMWIGLIHMLCSFERSRGIIDGNLFWSQFELAVDKWDKTLKRKEALIRAESLWYCLFGLTAISHYSATGECQQKSYLQQYWHLVVKALACIRLRLEEQVESRMTWSSLAKRDSYVRILLQRCSLLAVEWKWSMDGSDAALARLFDIFNCHKLSDLPSESDHDFPAFLRDFNVDKLDLDDFRSEESEREPCYQLFLKLLARAGLESRALAKDDRDGDRRVSRLFSRMTPVRVMPFTRANVPTSSERSVLFNHYAVVMLFLHLVPSSSSQRLRQIQSFLPSLTNADFLSHVTCIRAMMYVAVLFRHHQLDVAPVTKWFGETMTTLLQEYNELEKATGLYNRQQQQKQAQGSMGGDDARMAPVFANAPARQAAVHRKGEVTRLLVTALRSTQHVIRHSNLNSGRGIDTVRLPDLHLLHLSWTKHLLEAQLAIEPLIGQEALKCIQTFLLARIAALGPSSPVHTSRVAAQEESQDSFAELFEADDDFDFEDPLLAQLLDGQSTAANGRDTAGQSADLGALARQWDREFSQYVKDVLSPSLFHLLSNIYHPDRRDQQSHGTDVFTLGMTERITDQRFGSATSTAGGARARMAMLLRVAERRKYLELVVDCWAGCGHVLVANGLREWTSYLGFGNESWKRIDDPIGRRDVGLRFLQNVLSLDGKMASIREYESEFLTVWIQTAVARVLSVQDVFTNSLLEAGLGKHGGVMLRDLAPRWKRVLAVETQSNQSEASKDMVPLDLETFLHVRRALLKTTFEWLLDLSTSSGSASTVYSALSAVLSSLRVYVEDTPPSTGRSDDTSTSYLRFCHHTLTCLHTHFQHSTVFTSLTHEYANTLAVVQKRVNAIPTTADG